MKQGDCFYGKPPRSGKDPHFWFVLTNPTAEGDVVIVNVTTPDGPTKAQILKKSSYTELEYDSIVFWPGATICKVEALTKAVSLGLFSVRPALGVVGAKEMVAEGEVRGLIKTETLKALKAAGVCH